MAKTTSKKNSKSNFKPIEFNPLERKIPEERLRQYAEANSDGIRIIKEAKKAKKK